jgi:hypothetical protein
VHFGLTQNGYEQKQFEQIKILCLPAKAIEYFPHASWLELELYS